MTQGAKIDYIEFHSTDLEASKAFFAQAFGWGFTDYGPDYCDAKGVGVDVGLFRSDSMAVASKGAPRVIFFSPNLEDTLARVKAAGGVICRGIKHFPGGRRFHFIEPGGNELGVWSDVEPDGTAIG